MMRSMGVGGSGSQKPLGKGDLTVDAWGTQKVSLPVSLFHGLWTYDIPASMWFMYENNTQVYTSTNITSVGGVAVVEADVTNTSTRLESRECPRYQPNRGHLYSDAGFITNRENGDIRHGLIMYDASGDIENGVFFWHKAAGGVYATIVSGGIERTSELIDTSALGAFDDEMSNIYDIQFQWRSAGNYHFYIGNTHTGTQQLVKSIKYLGTLQRASIENPALPATASAEYGTGNVSWSWGCADITAENGLTNTEQYTSAYVNAVSVSSDTPVIIISNPLLINTKPNSRTTTLARISVNCSKKAVFKVWATRTPADITGETLVALGNGSFMETDSTDMNAGASRATSVTVANMLPITSIQVEATVRISVDNPYRGRIEFPIVRGDYLVVTCTASSASADCLVEMGEQV